MSCSQSQVECSIVCETERYDVINDERYVDMLFLINYLNIYNIYYIYIYLVCILYIICYIYIYNKILLTFYLNFVLF